MNIPEISVIMSVYNGEDYLRPTLQSILAQTFKNWELIVINDCSSDSTGQILDEFAKKDERVKVFTNEVNLRLPSSLNKAIDIAKGKYIARMDADDICLPQRLEKQYEFMQNNPDTALSTCRFLTLKNGVYASGGCGGRCDAGSIAALLLFTNPILHPGVIAKAEVMKAYKYDPTHTCTEDFELWTRIACDNLKMQILPEYLMIYRLHDKQITKTTLERQRGEVLKLQKVYYSKVLEAMDAKREEFYIKGIYFRENIDINKFIKFYSHIKLLNKKRKSFTAEAVDYAAFEILAEYKRCNIGKAQIIKAMLKFNGLFLIKEVFRRKKSAYFDGKKCINTAESLGLKRTGGTSAFPVFSQADK